LGSLVNIPKIKLFKFAKDLEPKQKLLLTMVGVGAGIITFYSIKNAIKKGKHKKTMDRLFELYNQSITTGKGEDAKEYNLALKASIIYDSFYNNDIFGWSENEARASQTLFSVPKKLVPLLAKYYKTLYGKVLQHDFVKFLREDQWTKRHTEYFS